MSEDVMFTRMTSSNLLAQVHGSNDSRFLILPIIEHASSIKGWVVFDTRTGSIARPEGAVEGYVPAVDNVSGYWEKLFQARGWLVETFYGSAA